MRRADSWVVRCSPFPAWRHRQVRPEQSAVFVHGDTSPAGRRPNETRGQLWPGTPSPLPKWRPPGKSQRCAGQPELAAERGRGSGEGWGLLFPGEAGRGGAENRVGRAIVGWWEISRFASAVSGGGPVPRTFGGRGEMAAS